MRKKRLEARLARLQSKLSGITARVSASTDAAEVRSLTEQAQDINAEIEDVQAELSEIAEEEARSAQVPANAQTVNPIALGSFTAPATQQRSENPLASMEYRQAFMAYATKGTPIPAEFRSGAAINTEDTGAAIPMTVMNEVINTIRKRYGNLYRKVVKTAIPGGVESPVALNTLLALSEQPSSGLTKAPFRLVRRQAHLIRLYSVTILQKSELHRHS